MKNKTPLKLSIILIVFVVIIIVLQVRSKDVYESESIILERELSDVLLDVKVPETFTNKQTQIRREGYDINEKPFEKGNYGYDERTRDFRLVCKTNCPVSKKILDQEFAAISYAVSTIRGITQIDIDDSLLPFEVHASEDTRCPKIDAPAYKSRYTDSQGNTRGLLCFFFDVVEYDRSNFPYSTSVHEVVHLFQDTRFPIYTGNNRILTEGLSMIVDSFFEKGSNIDSFCWERNKWYTSYRHQTDSVHVKGASLFFELCDQYGFDYDNLPELFSKLDAKGTSATVNEFIQIINSIVGRDTSHIFREVGVI